jgi:hypothetical protein
MCAAYWCCSVVICDAIRPERWCLIFKIWLYCNDAADGSTWNFGTLSVIDTEVEILWNGHETRMLNHYIQCSLSRKHGISFPLNLTGTYFITLFAVTTALALLPPLMLQNSSKSLIFSRFSWRRRDPKFTGLNTCPNVPHRTLLYFAASINTKNFLHLVPLTLLVLYFDSQNKQR